MDLARTSVFLDFDGTISTHDTGVHLLERLAPPGWRSLDERYDAGEIGSRECIAAQFAMLPRDAALVERVAAEIPLDSGFSSLVAMLREAGAEITVVSDGFGIGVASRCAGLEVLTSDGDPSTGIIRFPHTRPDCPCAECGTCKRAPIESARARGRVTVLAGDGTSDRHAAEVADVVFAKSSLAAWCASNGIAFEPFVTLHDVAAGLRRMSGC